MIQSGEKCYREINKNNRKKNVGRTTVERVRLFLCRNHILGGEGRREIICTKYMKKYVNLYVMM